MPPAGFEPAFLATERPQTYTLHRTGTGIGGFDPRTVQSVVSRYTDWATLIQELDIVRGSSNTDWEQSKKTS